VYNVPVIERIMAIQGHPRSLILVPIESMSVTTDFLVIHRNLGPYLAPVQRLNGRKLQIKFVSTLLPFNTVGRT